MIHVIRRMFFLNPGRHREGGSPRRSFSGRPSVQTSSFSATFLHLPPSLAPYFSSKCAPQKNLSRTMQQYKKFYFQFLTSLFTAGCIATGLCDSVSLRISTQRCKMVKMFSTTKHYSNITKRQQTVLPTAMYNLQEHASGLWHCFWSQDSNLRPLALIDCCAVHHLEKAWLN